MSPQQISEELKRISSRVPKAWLKSVATEQKVTPDIEFVVQEALKGNDLATDTRKGAQEMYDRGDFSKKKLVANPKIEKLLDQWYAREINKAIKEGRLPKQRTLKDPFLKKMYEN